MVLFGAYALAPLQKSEHDANDYVAFAVALACIGVVTTWQIVAVSRSPFPRLRAFEAIAVSAPLLVLVFAATYVSMSNGTAGSFTSSMTKIDAIYFTVTVLATVGFGDITAVSETARIVVTIQMIVDIVFIGVVVRALVMVTQRRVASLSKADAEDFPPAPSKT
ncbi:MAG TPA: potassium channel family protein [Actinomycetes bacterium]|nr:potassium channel family protein [Actinomycetes bacterium]